MFFFMNLRWAFSENRRKITRIVNRIFSCFSCASAKIYKKSNEFPLNSPPSKKVHWFFTFQFSVPCFERVSTRRLFSLRSCFLMIPKNVLQFHPPRNSSNDNERISPFFALRVVMTIWQKKVRRYRINVHSTPRWSSRYNQVVPSATLAQWKIQSLFSSFYIKL